MHPVRFTTFSRLLPALAILLAAGRVDAQCTITGPTQVCGSPVTLCGPFEGEVFEWTLPDGSSAFDQCITVSSPGTYSVRWFDPEHGEWMGPCVREMSGGSAAPAIAGLANACIGEVTELCGPEGDFEYEWLGPNNISGIFRCLGVAESGTYQLRVRPAGSDCWSEWANHPIVFGTCGDPDPDPDPAPPGCPKAAWWWAQQCPDHDRSHVRLSPALVGAIGDCVASNGAQLDGSFCRTMLAKKRTLAMKAQRQVAAVWANVCANGMDVRARDGRKVGLDPDAMIDLPQFHGTVESWLASASSQMVALRGSNERRRETQDAYRRVIRVAWHLNHGIGIGPTCDSGNELVAGDASLSEESDPEPLAAELMEDSEASLAFGAIEPNPTRGDLSMAYVVATPAASDVSIGVYDLTGRLVRQLVNGSVAPGQYVVRWNGHGENGEPVRGGVYFIMGRVGGEVVQTRVSLVR